MPHVEVNGARLWVKEEGEGPAVLFVHGGLGDHRLFEPQARALADEFRCIRYDLRFWGWSQALGEEFSSIDDAVAVLDSLGVERSALVGLSLGGTLALDVALAHPHRVWAVVNVAGGVSGLSVSPYTLEEDAAFDAALERGDVDAAMDIDFAIWAPLGVEERFRELWRATPENGRLPEGAKPRPRPDAHERLGEIAVPTLVVVAKHDPAELRALGARVARGVPGAQFVQVDSDHYLTLREPELVSRVLREFLSAAAPVGPR
jgi:pimeloyl-ACP methyl ester carboxylesterase